MKENYSLDRERFAMSQFGVSSGDEFHKRTVPRVAETYLAQLDSVSSGLLLFSSSKLFLVLYIQSAHQFDAQPKQDQLSIAVLSRLISETHMQLVDSTRWRKVRFSVSSGQNWKNKPPQRIASHEKR